MLNRYGFFKGGATFPMKIYLIGINFYRNKGGGNSADF